MLMRWQCRRNYIFNLLFSCHDFKKPLLWQQMKKYWKVKFNYKPNFDSAFPFVLYLAWCAEKQIQTPLEAMKIGQLDQNLRRFCAEERTKMGEDYSKSTLLGFRHSIERFLNAPPFSRGLQISTDPTFARSNLMLDAQIKNLKVGTHDGTSPCD